MSLDQFIRLADGIVEFEADLNDNRFPVTSLHALEVHRYELKSNWSRLKAAYDRFIFDAEKESQESDDPLDIESFKLKYKSTYITYCNCLTRLSEMTDALRSQSTTVQEVDSRPTDSSFRPVIGRDFDQHNVSPSSNGLHLPPIEIETFYGDYVSWPTFRDLFSAVVANSKASNVEKLFYLIQKTKGEAREIVQKSPLTHDGFELAWRELCSRFENRRVLVNSQLKILFNLQTVTSESGKTLKQLQRDINSCISILKSYKIDVSNWDPIFVFICTNRLPEDTLTLWEQQLKDKTVIPKWSELDDFLTNRYRTLESVSEIRYFEKQKHDSKSKGIPNSTSNKRVHSFQTNISGQKCHQCPKEIHPIRKCPKFLKMNHQQRLNEIKKEGLCLNCFSKTHTVRTCNSKHNCFTCHKRHNTLLHKFDIVTPSSQTPETNATNSSLNPNSVPFLNSNNDNIQSTNLANTSRIQSCFVTNSKKILLGTAWINICHLGVKYQARALIDSGSEGTFISERLLNLLQLPSQRTNAQVSGLNNSVSAQVNRQCNLLLGSQLDDKIEIPVTALVVPHLSNNLPSRSIPDFTFSNLPEIPLADPKFYCSMKIDMLIGGDIFPLIVRSGIKHQVCNSLIAQETVFGWILTGPILHSATPNSIIVSNFCEISLDKEISRFWKVENLPKKNFMSPSDMACEDLYNRSTKRRSDGRYVVSLPFKDGFPDSINVGHSRSSALAQFYKNEVRLLKTPEFKFEYDRVVTEYEFLDHMVKVKSPSLGDSSKYYYLPHHAVIKPDSSTTKVRVVFNASASSSNGYSLNSLLHIGPILQNDLNLLILKWRFFQFVFNLFSMPADHFLHEDFLKFEDCSSAKTLGIRWNACTDEFYFVSSPFPETLKYTKRVVLSQIAKLFDPAGWLAPCVILAKILMQKIWMEGTDWDEIINSDTLHQWKTFQYNFSAINSIRVPRWIQYCPKNEVQFHGFCDASEKAYAATLYVRISDSTSFYTHLISSKTKVAPIKTLSIPRLELCGAVLLAEMVETLLPRLDIEKYSVHCWTDSTIVLSWLAKPPCHWLTFIANRVAKITQVTSYSQWNHVSSETNPADIASRGLYPQDLLNNDLWWYGPRWLQDDKDKWPCIDLSCIQSKELEAKPVRVHFTYFSNFEDILDRFSSYSKALRVMVYVYRFFYRTHRRHRNSFSKTSTSLTSSEINLVRDRLISISQKVWYPNEYKALSVGQSISKSSSILSLNPFLDKEGLIRSCGRLESSTGLSYNESHPVIMPYNSQFTRLLIKFIHDVSLHGGNQLVLRLVRAQYWIPKVKNLIKATINKCKTCIIYKKRCQTQIMAALPSERSEISRPFTHTGIDFAGPIDVKSYSGRACRISKGYVCVFVCFSTKAIHLEATTDLSTKTFLAAFTRFISRRGCPLHLHSDNGKNFVGASKVLAKEFIQTSQEYILSHYTHQNISWHFIPAGAPHMGGLWEAGVKSFKTHFRKVAGNYRFTFEELSTLLAKIESCLNSRPISSISTDPTDLCALTPGHFLIGTPILAPIDPQVNDSPISIRNRWQRLKAIHQNFCFRWKNEYLREMNKRNKWKQPVSNVNVGDLVVIKDENLPPNSWRLGRVIKTYPGSDNRVRVADLLTQRGQISRPISNMPNRSSTSSKSKVKSTANHLPLNYNAYPCRLCKRPHPLRTCRKFLAMNMTDRIRAVRDNNYCSNCLAHNHSHGTCFSKEGCKHCHKYHHTLLHVNSKLIKDILPSTSPSRSSSRTSNPAPSTSSRKRRSSETRDSSPQSKSSPITLTKIIRQNTVILLPTVLVKIGSTTSHARCLLDTASPVSRVAKSFVDSLSLTAYTLKEETICPLVLKSRYDSSSKIEGTFRVDNRISLHSPTQSLPESYKKNFRDMFLADSNFYQSAPIDIVIGVELYPKIICQGVINRAGFPTAQSTIFGWIIYGQCSL